MILDVNRTISDRARTQVVPIKAALTHLLDNAPATTRDEARCNGRLCDKITEAEMTVDLTDDDLARIKKALESDKGMKSWAMEGIEYFLWPGDLADSDKERLAARYNKDGNGIAVET